MSIIHWTEHDDDAMFGPARVEEHLSVAQHEKKYPPRPSEQMMVAGHEAVYDLEHDNWLCRHCSAVWEWAGLSLGYRPVTACAESPCAFYTAPAEARFNLPAGTPSSKSSR